MFTVHCSVDKISVSLLLPPASSAQDGSDPDEDVDGVHVNSHAGVDRIKGRGSISHGMPLSPVDDLLCVVKQEGPEQDETSVDGDRVETSSHSSGRWEEGRAQAGTEHNS